MGRASSNDSAASVLCVRRASLIEAYQADHRIYEQTAEIAAAAGFVGIRLDGCSFHTFTKCYEKPFDVRIEQAMDAACEALMTRLTEAVCCYTQSDEISLLIKPDSDWQRRRLEKMVSVSASVASVAFSTKIGATALFDARLLQLPGEEDALAMLAERQQDAIKNAVSVIAFYLLREQGMSATKAERELARRGGLRSRMQLLEEHGVPFNSIPPARRRGRLLKRVSVEREGFNPLLQQPVTVTRRTLEWDLDIPDFRYVDTLPGYAAEDDE